MSRIVLASGSPRRKQLLEWAEVKFDIVVTNADESFPDDMPVEEIPVHIARKKANAVKLNYDNTIVVAADTVVVLNGEIIGKPTDADDAFRILSALSGNMHDVITGVVIKTLQNEIAFYDKTSVWFHPLSAEQLRYYIEHYKPYDKAGAYAIQEWIGVVGIEKIEGDFYNVMGLPVSRVVKEILRLQGR